MTSWQKWDVEKMTSWQEYHVDKMTSWGIDKLMEWQVHEMSSSWNDTLVEWEVYNWKLAKCQVDEMSQHFGVVLTSRDSSFHKFAFDCRNAA